MVKYKRKIVESAFLLMYILFCLMYGNGKNNDVYIHMDSSMFSKDDSDEYNKFIAFQEEKYIDKILEIDGVDNVEVSIEKTNKTYESIIVSIVVDDDILSDIDQEYLEKNIIEYLQAENEDADITIDIAE